MIDIWYWQHMGLWGWLMMLAFWVLVVVLVIWAVRTATPPQHRDDHTAQQILDERLARGEIDSAEYEERRRLRGARK